MSLNFYHRLPPAARSAAATLRGLYLRAWRYGAGTERWVEESLAREQWSPEQWRGWQEERLARLLHRAATCVPYYRTRWAERRRRGDRAGFEYLENWPVLTKDDLRRDAPAFLADDCEARRMFHEHTSGTTGKSLDLWWSRETVQAWYGVWELRSRLWYGVSRHDRWAMVGGQLVAPVARRQPPFWVWNAGLNQLYLSSYHLAPDLIPHYLDALARYRVKYLLGYTSSLYALAQGVLRLKRRDLRMVVAVTNAEPVYDYQRAVIAEAFQCPVRESYGMAEIVAAASECEAGRLHLWPEVGTVEVEDRGRTVTAGAAGDLIGTGLMNVDMPLVRYRVGDRATLAARDAACVCGRTLPLVEAIEGRSDDTLYTTDGRRVGRLDPVFKANLPVSEAQIIQEAPDRLRVRFVPADGWTAAAGRSIVERLRARMGEVEVTLEEVTEVPRVASGKFRAVICNLSPEQKAQFELSPALTRDLAAGR